MQTNCPVCGSELKTIPAGVSKKTGKAYQSFTACPNKCKTSWNGNKTSPDAQNGGKVNVSGQDPITILADMVSATLTKEHFDQRMDAMATYLKSKLG